MPTATETEADVTRAARELWDEREDTGLLRDHHAFEAVFLAAVARIQRERARELGEAARTWGSESRSYEALANLVDHTTSLRLAKAHLEYLRARAAHMEDA